MNFSGWQLDTKEGLKRLRELIGDIHPTYVGLDPMAEFHSQSENDANKMLANFLRPIRAIAHEFECLVTFSHHTRKSYAGQDADLQQTGRGTTAIKGWADSAWYLKKVGDVLQVETKQRKGSAEFPAVSTFSLRRIEDRAAQTQTWEISLGIEDDLQARHDAAQVLTFILQETGAADSVINRTLEAAFPRWPSRRLDAAVGYLEKAQSITIAYERRPGKDGKMREQKVLRPANRGTEDNQGLNRGQSSVQSNRGTEDNPLKGCTGS